MANPTTNYGFVMPSPTDLVTDLPADFDVFGQAVDTQMLANANAAIAKTIVDAKGDIIAATAADTVSRLAVGANNTVLTADSTTATGLKWATPATSASGMTFISRTTFSSVASVNIDNFDNTYESYLMIIENIHAATSTDDILMLGRYATTTHTGADYYATNPTSTFNSSSFTFYNTNGGTAFTLMPSTNSGYPANAAIRFADVGDASRYFSAYGQWVTREGMLNGQFGGEIFSLQTWSGIQLKSSSSNITGAVSMYGLAKA
jgi:hypothetical protein